MIYQTGQIWPILVIDDFVNCNQEVGEILIYTKENN